MKLKFPVADIADIGPALPHDNTSHRPPPGNPRQRRDRREHHHREAHCFGQQEQPGTHRRHSRGRGVEGRTAVTLKGGPDYGPYFDGAPAFADYTVTLERGEQQVFQITARTFRHYVRWNVELDIFADGRTTIVTANVNGETLETTALLVPPGGPTTDPDQTKYREVYDYFASPNTDRFARTR